MIEIKSLVWVDSQIILIGSRIEIASLKDDC